MHAFEMRWLSLAAILATAAGVFAHASPPAGSPRSGSAYAGDIPLDEAGFGEYIQRRLQLYSRSPIKVAGPFTVSVAEPGGDKILPSFEPLHEMCMRQPSECERAADSYVSDTVHSIQQASPEPARASSVVTLRVCNRSTSDLYIAGVYIPLGGTDWRSEGQFKVPASSCGNVFETSNATFYVRAQRDSLLDAPSHGNAATEQSSTVGDIKLCARNQSAYHFTTDISSRSCSGGAQLVDFRTIHSEGSAVYVWNLEE
jgi:uncharacterized membrane protein